jgi:hypothetical protein
LKILERFTHKCFLLPIALDVGRGKAEAMLILFKVRLSNEKIRRVTRPQHSKESRQKWFVTGVNAAS